MINSNTPNVMQASVLHGIHDIRNEEINVPTPGAGEVLLKVAAVGVCGSDVHYYNEGRIGNQVVTDPIIMGHEFSAHVARLGEDVRDLQVGQLVAVDPAIPCGRCEMCLRGHPNLCPEVKFCGTPPINGVFSEYCVMPATNCFLLPEGMTADEGSLLEPLGVALHSVVLSHLKPGDNVAVLGAGPIGILTAMVAWLAGASRVYVTEPLAYRRKFAVEHGVDMAIDPYADDPAGVILDLTSGRGVDIVFEAAGADDTPEQAGEMVCVGGKIILVGIPASDNVSFTASTVRRKGVGIKMVRRMKNTYPRTIRMVADGSINLKALITHHLPLFGVGEAMDLLSHYRDGVIKVVINP